MSRTFRLNLAFIAFLGLAGGARGFGSQPQAAALLERFSNAWPERRKPYRMTGDQSWKAYALTLRQLAALGPKSAPALLAGCGHKNAQVRALCARLLGFLKVDAAVPALIRLLDDPKPYVAVPAADALGQIQDPKGLAALKKARSRIKKGDVLLHISRALERKVPLEADVRAQLLKIDPRTLDSARPGQPAPDFALKDANGKVWTVSQFKGKKALLLVFLYGDG